MAQRHSPHKVSRSLNNNILPQTHSTEIVSKMCRCTTEKVRSDQFYEIHIHISFVLERERYSREVERKLGDISIL